jgi:PAS domain S-box-containing protein
LLVAAKRRYEDMSKAELLDEIRTVQQTVGMSGALVDIVHELQVHQEEVRAQQSQLLEAQHALEESRDRYADLYDFAPIGFVTLDPVGVIHEANLAAAALLGAERARLIGLPLLVHVVDRDRRLFLDHLNRCRTSSGTVQTKLSLRKKIGGEMRVTLVTRASAEPSWHTGIFDLTEGERAEVERRRLEGERLRLLREEESLRAAAATKDRFLAALSHELRTPLTPVLFTLASLEARETIPDDLREPLAMIRRNIEVETRLIDDLLDTTRIVHGKLHMEEKPVDVHAVLRSALEGIAHDAAATHLKVDLELHADEHHVLGDAVRLRQVVVNVLNNAIQHTPPGGSIMVASRNDRPGCLTVRITDTGSGIEPDQIERIFEPFEQVSGRERAGLGLGLAISKGIVDAHRGRIRARSDGPGHGATFEIDLDAIPDVDQRAEKRGDDSSAGRPLRVLLVEDHHDSALALCEILSLYGHNATLSESYSEALQHRGEAFDLLITDIGLPDGSGLDLLHDLDGEGRLRGITLSGYGSDTDIARSRAKGFDRHLTKPVQVDELLGAIASVAGRNGNGHSMSRVGA